jgi:fumarate reductase iron-sulfur subunit
LDSGVDARLAARTMEVEVLRYRPEQELEPVWQSFTIEYTETASVLEALQTIKDEQDPTLSFRWSCRMAICGSCGMMINGVPKLACRTFLHEYFPARVRIAPLEHFPIERDLVVGAADFIRKLESITPYIVAKEPRSLEQGEYLQTPAQLERFNQFTKCINCMLCYAACPQYGLNSEFLGPAVTALAHRYNADSRDGAKADRMELLHTEEGLWGCTAVGYCSEVCPKDVDPANAVNQNKMASALDYFLRFLKPGRSA